MEKILKNLAFLLIILITLMTSPKVGLSQVSLPPVNLGGTSFMDALSFPGHILVLQQIGIFYHAYRFYMQDEKIPGDNELSSFTTQTQIIYQPPFTILGGHPALNFLFQLAVLSADTDFPLTVSSDVLADLIIGPLIQWPDRRLFGKPFYQRLALDFILPTGSYRSQFNINPGSNVFSINPYYAFTYFFTDDRRLEFSLRSHYLWNSKNADPPEISLPPTPTNPNGQIIQFDNIQPGQAVHFNFGLSYELIPNFRIGVNGYYLKQITNDKINGEEVPGSKEQVLGIGPGFMVRYGTFLVFFNSFFETLAEDRPQGFTFILRFLTFVPFGKGGR